MNSLKYSSDFDISGYEIQNMHALLRESMIFLDIFELKADDFA